MRVIEKESEQRAETGGRNTWETEQGRRIEGTEGSRMVKRRE